MILLDHICILSNDYPSAKRPVYVFVEQLVNALVDKGVKVSVVAPQSLTKCLIRRIPVLIRKQAYNSPLGNRYDVYRPYILSFGNGKKWLYRLASRFNQRRIDRCIGEIKPKVLYGHFWHNANSLKDYALSHNLPLFVACGEGDDAMEMLEAALSPIEKVKLASIVKGVICVSSENRRKSLAYGFTNERNTIVLPNAVDTRLFHPMEKNDVLRKELGVDEDDFLILFVGAFIPRKGSGILAKAITLINDQHVKAIFIGRAMPGDVDEPECNGIVFKGRIPHEKLPAYYASADVFVLPTQNEGCSNAIIEALAMGLPVISSNRAFNDDILNDENSIRIDPTNVDEIANAIIKMRDDKLLCKRLSEGALKTALELRIDKRAERIITFINRQMNQ